MDATQFPQTGALGQIRLGMPPSEVTCRMSDAFSNLADALVVLLRSPLTGTTRCSFQNGSGDIGGSCAARTSASSCRF
jgi:hypothetical protein